MPPTPRSWNKGKTACPDSATLVGQINAAENACSQPSRLKRLLALSADGRAGRRQAESCCAKTSASQPRYLLQDPTGAPSATRSFCGASTNRVWLHPIALTSARPPWSRWPKSSKTVGQSDRVQAIFISGRSGTRHRQGAQDLHRIFRPRILGLTSVRQPWFAGQPTISRFCYAKVREPGGDPPLCRRPFGRLILLGPDGEFIKKFAFSMPTTEIAAKLANC